MANDLSAVRDRVEVVLMDTGNAIWDTDTIDEAIRKALHRYSEVKPLEVETVITLPGTGREIALNELTGLIHVSQVWWPYDSDCDEEWPPNRAGGFDLWWDDGRAVLFLSDIVGNQPQLDDELRIWYSRAQTIQDLDGAAATSLFDHHKSGIVTGAAGFAAMSRAVGMIEETNVDLYQVSLLGMWANSKMKEFGAWINDLSAEAPTKNAMPSKGWALDKWDSNG